MPNSSRIDRIISLFQQKERILAIRLAKVQSELLEHKQLVEHLDQYQMEYKNRLVESGRLGLEGTKLSEFDSFVYQIGQTIKSHDKEFAALANRYQMAKTQWEEIYKRIKILSQLKDKLASHESTQHEKQLLLEMEDWFAHVR